MAKWGAHWPARGTTKDDAGLRLGFRSGLEKKNADHLTANGAPYTFEERKVRYAVPLTWHTYTPDFELANGIIVETKGRWLAQDRAKMLLVRAQYPDLDIRMVFSAASTKIGPNSKTTVTQWADKHSIPWAIKLIPVEWVQEAGPKVKPAEVLKRGPLGY